MHDLRNDPAIDPVAERTAFLRQWQPLVSDAPRTNTELHTPDGQRFTNLSLPKGTVPTVPLEVAPAWQVDIRDAGQKLADLERTVAALAERVARLEGGA